MMNLVLFWADENPLDRAESERHVAMPQVTAQQIEHEAKHVHAEKGESGEARIKEEYEYTRAHAEAQAVSQSRDRALERVRSIKGKRSEHASRVVGAVECP